MSTGLGLECQRNVELVRRLYRGRARPMLAEQKPMSIPSASYQPACGPIPLGVCRLRPGKLGLGRHKPPGVHVRPTTENTVRGEHLGGGSETWLVSLIRHAVAPSLGERMLRYWKGHRRSIGARALSSAFVENDGASTTAQAHNTSSNWRHGSRVRSIKEPPKGKPPVRRDQTDGVRPSKQKALRQN